MSRAVERLRRRPGRASSTPEPRLIGASALSSRSVTVQHSASRLRHLPGNRHRGGGRDPAVPARARRRGARRRRRRDQLRPHGLLFPGKRAVPACDGNRGGHFDRCSSGACRERPDGPRLRRRLSTRSGPSGSCSGRCSSPVRSLTHHYAAWPGYIGGVVCALSRSLATRPLLTRVRGASRRRDARHPAVLRRGRRVRCSVPCPSSLRRSGRSRLRCCCGCCSPAAAARVRSTPAFGSSGSPLSAS